MLGVSQFTDIFHLTPPGGEALEAISASDQHGYATLVLAIFALILLVVIQPVRRFHRIVTGLGVFGLLSWAVMWVAGLLFVHRASFEANLPKYTGMTAAALQKAAVTGNVVGHGFSWATTVLPFLMGVVLFQYIGFQYSAYIAGEVRGNIKRGILIGVLGALFFVVHPLVSEVALCTGFRSDFSWIDLPVFGETEPKHYRGIVAEEPGLYFVGLHFLYAMSSGFLPGVGRDAEYVVEHIASRAR